MIPKKIHYCWFGGNPLPELAQKCIASWKKFCPDYEIVEWNERNFDVCFCDFAKEAFEAKKWAFLSDCARLEIVYREGGIYLDTDVELLKNLNDFLQYPAFFGTEGDKNRQCGGLIATGVGFGAEAGNKIVGELLLEYRERHFLMPDGSLDMQPCPQKNTKPFYPYGYQYSETEIWSIAEATVFPPEYFTPYNYQTREQHCTKNTVSIHHYSASWISPLEQIICKIDNCDKHEHAAEYKIRRCLSLPFRVVNKMQRQGLVETLCFIMQKRRKS